jgi:hypothetical protein
MELEGTDESGPSHELEYDPELEEDEEELHDDEVGEGMRWLMNTVDRRQLTGSHESVLTSSPVALSNLPQEAKPEGTPGPSNWPLRSRLHQVWNAMDLTTLVYPPTRPNGTTNPTESTSESNEDAQLNWLSPLTYLKLITYPPDTHPDALRRLSSKASFSGTPTFFYCERFILVYAFQI